MHLLKINKCFASKIPSILEVTIPSELPEKNFLPYSKILTRNDFNVEEISAVEELLFYFFNEINAVSRSGFQTT